MNFIPELLEIEKTRAQIESASFDYLQYLKDRMDKLDQKLNELIGIRG